MTSPTSSVGREHLDLHVGLEEDRRACSTAFLNAMDPATLNAISEEST